MATGTPTSIRSSADETLAIVEVGALGVFLISAAALQAPVLLANWVEALFLLLCALLCSGFAIQVSSRAPELAYGVSAAVLGFVAPSDRVVEVILVWAAGTLIGSSAVRRDLVSGARNAARMVLCAFVYFAIWELVDAGGVVFAAAAALATAGYLLVDLVLDLLPLLLRGQRLRDLVRSLLAWRIGLAFGINVLLVVLVHYAAPWLDALSGHPEAGIGLIVAFTVTAAFFFAFAMLDGVRAQRLRFDGVLGTALALPWPADRDPLEIMRSRAAEAVDCDGVEIRDAPPRLRRELGAPFRTPDGEERYLVAIRGPARSPFLPADLDALSAVAHIGEESMRVRSEARGLEEEASTDPLTGLPNYRAFQRSLAQAAAARAEGVGIAVVYLDLDGFKQVNDTHGHEAGNEVLRVVAGRLRMAVRPLDTVARVGGDEFVVVLSGLTGREDAVQVAERMARAVGEPMSVSGGAVAVTASLGIGYSDDPGEDPLALVEQADSRMYTGRRGRREPLPAPVPGPRRGPVPMPTPDALVAAGPAPQTPAPVAADYVGVVNEVIDERRLTVVYQPIVDNVVGEVVALEALVRAEHPAFGTIPPPLLVNEARRLGRLDALTAQVLELAFEDMTRFQEHAPALRAVHVNVEVDQITEERSLGRILELSAAHPRVGLTLELTENSLGRGTDALLAELDGLRGRGVSLALDDFGQAYSTMLSVVEYPFDVLKVDRALIQELLASEKARQVIRSLLLLSRKLDVRMVVEGVQTGAERDGLARLGVRYMQGYLFSPPVPAEELRSRFRGAGLIEPNARPVVEEHTAPRQR